MTTIQPNFLALSSDRQTIIGCHNLSSARAYASGRVPELRPYKGETRVKVTAYVSPTGQYYVMHGNVRIDCHNAATARYYVKNGVGVSTLDEVVAQQLLSIRNQ